MEKHDLWAALGGGVRNFHCIRLGSEDTWIPTGDCAWFERLWTGACWEHGEDKTLDARVSLVPCWERSWALPSEGNVLWALAARPRARDNIENWRHPPTLVVEWGKYEMGVWALHSPLPIGWVHRLNERIAHDARCERKWAALHTMLPLPGTHCVWARERVPVHVTSWTGELYGAKALCGDLRDAPDKDGWRKAAEAKLKAVDPQAELAL